MPRRLRSSIRPTEEPTTQQLSLPLTENHTRASSGANEPQMRIRGHDTPSRATGQPARVRRARKMEKVTGKKKVTELPHEVILNIITKLDFSRDDFMNMRLAIRTFNELLVAHSTSIINDIAAQQFPVASLVVAHGAPTVEWLIEAKDLEDRTDGFLSTCTGRLKRDSPHFNAIDNPHYRMIARVGLYVIACRKARRIEFESDGGDEDLRLLSYNVDKTLLLCINFAAAVISQALQSCIVDTEYRDIDERVRRASDSLLCVEGWDSMMGFLVGLFLKLEGDEAESARQSRKAFESRFEHLLAVVDMNNRYNEHVEYEATELSQVGAQFNAQVQGVVGKHETIQELDLTVIHELQKSKVSEGAILELLKGENWW